MCFISYKSNFFSYERFCRKIRFESQKPFVSPKKQNVEYATQQLRFQLSQLFSGSEQNVAEKITIDNKFSESSVRKLTED